MHISKAVEDLSRQFGRPTLGKVKFFVNDASGRALSIHDTMEDAEKALAAANVREVAEDVWAGLSEERRREIRREFNRLPGTEWESFPTVAHYAATIAGVI